jgi:integrase/recombinase XerD
MKIFRTYLQSQQLKSSTINEDIENVLRFIKWFGQEKEEQQAQLTVSQLVEYINVLQTGQLSPQTINIRLRSIKKYFDYLKSEGHYVSNFENVRVKGVVKKVVIDPLEYSDLEQLYKDYLTYLDEKPIREAKQKRTNLRKKVVVGFLLFQGLHTGELERLEINHINQMEGSIYIPSGSKNQSRTLKLNPFQFGVLFQYLATLQTSNRQENEARLFDFGMRNQVAVIMGELRGLNEKVQNMWHIRASVIMHWIRLHGKRQTQYMIGHKRINSTEHYEQQNLEELTDLLTKHHPFKVGY